MNYSLGVIRNVSIVLYLRRQIVFPLWVPDVGFGSLVAVVAVQVVPAISSVLVYAFYPFYPCNTKCAFFMNVTM